VEILLSLEVFLAGNQRLTLSNYWLKWSKIGQIAFYVNDIQLFCQTQDFYLNELIAKGFVEIASNEYTNYAC
jgi:hypothetical protein